MGFSKLVEFFIRFYAAITKAISSSRPPATLEIAVELSAQSKTLSAPVVMAAASVPSAGPAIQYATSISTTGLQLLWDLEGFRAKIYRDVAGYPTIGVGHLLTAEDKRTDRFSGRSLTEEEGRELLRADVAVAERAIAKYVKVPLTQPCYDALCSFVFNLGSNALARSNLLKRLNAGEYGAVPEELMKWTRAKNPKTGALEVNKGLERRRKIEADLWRTG